MIPRYHILLAPDEFAGEPPRLCWAAMLAEAPGVCAIGDTPAEALAALEGVVTTILGHTTLSLQLPRPLTGDGRRALLDLLWGLAHG